MSALAVAAAAAVALVVPAMVPGGGGGIVAALGLDRDGTAPVPSADASPAPDPATGPWLSWAHGMSSSIPASVGDAFVLTDAQVEAFVAGVQGQPRGVLGIDDARQLPDNNRESELLLGWCREAPLPVMINARESVQGDDATWSATWRSGTTARPGVGVDETAVTWFDSVPTSSPSGSETAQAYVRATSGSPTTCDGAVGPALASAFQVLPAPLPGAVQAVAPVQGRPGTWQVRSVASAAGSSTAVDLTVVLPSTSAQEAGRAAVPLLRQALERAIAGDAVKKAVPEAGTVPEVPPVATAPGRVVVRPYGYLDGTLTPGQVEAVLPAAARASEPYGDLDPKDQSCLGPLRVPEAYDDSGNGVMTAAFEVSGGSGSSAREWLMYWTPPGQISVVPRVPISGSSLFGLGSTCGPAPAGEAWEPVTLAHAGVDVPVVVRHPGGDPQRWVVLVTASPQPAVAVGLEVEMTAASQDEVAAVVQPLLAAAQKRAYDANFVPSAP